jgi:hypothetical protein
MPRAQLISLDLLQSMFEALDILGKIDRRELTTHDVAVSPAKNPRYAGGTSYIRIHRRPSDHTHVATTHVIEVPGQPSPPHRHAKLLLLGSIKFASEEH